MESGVPSITVGIHPSDPPPSAKDKGVAIVEARGPGGGDLSRTIVDPLVALESLERPMTIPPFTDPASPTDAAKPVGDAKKDSAKTIAFGDPVLLPDVRGEPAPPLVPKMDDAEAAKADKQTSLRSTIALGSVEPESPPPTPAEHGERAQPLASTIAFGSSAAKSAPAVSSSEAKAAPAQANPDANDGTSSKTEKTAKSKSKSKSKGGSKDSDKRGVGRKTELGGIGLRDEADADVHEQFFSEGDLARHLDVPDALDASDALTVQDKVKRKADPEVVERRARFVRYVKVAVAGAAFLCLIAVVRESVVAKPPPDVAQTTSPQPIVKAADPTVGAHAPAPVRTAPSAVASAASGALGGNESPPPEERAESVGASVSATPSAAASSSASSVSSSGSGKDEKEKARVALEHGKAADAIEAGERAVAIDPTDGESWLILGAAYQEKGDMVGARRAYSSCVKEGKTGPRSECAKMLR